MEHQHRVCYGFAMIAYADHYRLPGPDLRTEIPLVSFFCWVCLSRVTTALTATAHPVQSFTASCPLWQSCLYLPRPLTLERGCFLIEHTISSGCRTGGFCVPLGQRIQSLRSAKSACSGVGGVAKWRRFFINLRSAAASPGERKVYQTRRSDVSSVSYVSYLSFVPYKLFRIKIVSNCCVFVLTFLAAKPGIIVLCEICVVTVFTQSQRILLVGQHEGQHQMDELL